jgi:hypothetical protein
VAYHQKQYEILLPQVKTTFFTLFYTASHISVFVLYTYIVLHVYVKSYKCICFYTFTVLHGIK